MQTQKPSLTELSAAMPLPPEGVSPAVAIIAQTDPNTLRGAAEGAILDQARATWQSDGKVVAARENSYQEMASIYGNALEDRQAWSSAFARQVQDDITFLQIISGGQATPTARHLDILFEAQERGVAGLTAEELVNLDGIHAEVERARADQAAAEARAADLEPTRLFGEEIIETRRRLSRPVRRAAAIMCAIAVGLPSGIFTNNTVSASNQQANQDYAQSAQISPGAENVQSGSDNTALIAAGGVGATGGLIGAAVGLGLGAALSGGAAQRRAKKIVQKAQIV